MGLAPSDHHKLCTDCWQIYHEDQMIQLLTGSYGQYEWLCVPCDAVRFPPKEKTCSN